jgi:hypothetical protein
MECAEAALPDLPASAGMTARVVLGALCALCGSIHRAMPGPCLTANKGLHATTGARYGVGNAKTTISSLRPKTPPSPPAAIATN